MQVPCLYRLDTPRASFLSFFLFSPRAPVRFALGAAFLRAVRFSFLRSSLSSTLVVSATYNLFHCNLFWVSRKTGQREVYVNRELARMKATAHPHAVQSFANDEPQSGEAEHGFQRTIDIRTETDPAACSALAFLLLLTSPAPHATINLLTGVKSCVLTRFIVRSRRE